MGWADAYVYMKWSSRIEDHMTWIVNRPHRYSRFTQKSSANFVFSCSWLHRSVKTSEANWRKSILTVQTCADLCSHWRHLKFTRFGCMASQQHAQGSWWVPGLWHSHLTAQKSTILWLDALETVSQWPAHTTESSDQPSWHKRSFKRHHIWPLHDNTDSDRSSHNASGKTHLSM